MKSLSCPFRYPTTCLISAITMKACKNIFGLIFTKSCAFFNLAANHN